MKSQNAKMASTLNASEKILDNGTETPANIPENPYKSAEEAYLSYQGNKPKMLRLLMLGFEGKRDDVFETPPFSEANAKMKKAVKLHKQDLLDEIKRRTNVLMARHQGYPDTIKKIFYDSKGAAPAPSQWKVQECMDWLLDPMHSAVNDADTAFCIKALAEYRDLIQRNKEEEASATVTNQVDPWKRSGFGLLYALVRLIHCVCHGSLCRDFFECDKSMNRAQLDGRNSYFLRKGSPQIQ